MLRLLVYLKMNAHLGRLRRQRKQECIAHGIPSIATTHDGECAELFLCCGLELFLAKPTVFKKEGGGVSLIL